MNWALHINICGVDHGNDHATGWPWVDVGWKGDVFEAERSGEREWLFGLQQA